MIELLYKLLVCHFIGDYVIQIDYIAKTKGDNLWHMIVHCFLYTVPFAMLLGINQQLGAILVSHFVVDSFKARWKIINYPTDQIAHIALLAVVYIL